eukprot:c33490_g1_i1 orf=31-267(+)
MFMLKGGNGTCCGCVALFGSFGSNGREHIRLASGKRDSRFCFSYPVGFSLQGIDWFSHKDDGHVQGWREAGHKCRQGE